MDVLGRDVEQGRLVVAHVLELVEVQGRVVHVVLVIHQTRIQLPMKRMNRKCAQLVEVQGRVVHVVLVIHRTRILLPMKRMKRKCVSILNKPLLKDLDIICTCS